MGGRPPLIASQGFHVRNWPHFSLENNIETLARDVDAVRTYRIREIKGSPHRAYYGSMLLLITLTLCLKPAQKLIFKLSSSATSNFGKSYSPPFHSSSDVASQGTGKFLIPSTSRVRLSNGILWASGWTCLGRRWSSCATKESIQRSQSMLLHMR